MQSVSLGDTLHEMSTPVFWLNTKNVNSSPEIAQRGTKVRKQINIVTMQYIFTCVLV